MLEKLTPEMEALIPVVRDEWINRLYDCKNTELEQKDAEEFVAWTYAKAGFTNPPMVIIVDSPAAAHKEANRLYREHVDPNAKDQFFAFGSSMGCSNYGWVAFYDFFTRIGIINHDDFNEYRNFTRLGIFNTIDLHDVCIVSKMPVEIHSTVVNGNRVLHGEDCSAIRFSDGFELYFWRGANVPKKWIMEKESLTKDDILGTDNAELRRALMEILGAKRYYDIISDGKGLKLIDEDTDHQGFPMRLYETKKKDDISEKKVQFLEVVDPSTGRVYNIYPPKQNAKNVWDAKAQTFSDQKLFVRQGDVGLTRVGFDEEMPVQET